ncbi:MAG: TonB-dependent receptor [Bacteroidia bacterium]|nr:TonB-dependent receptor [Bacteroidia bacterium]
MSALLLVPMYVFGQAPIVEDSLQTKQLEELIVTATRNERTMGALPMPVFLVPKMQIKSMGSLRLNDVLTEQTGLVIVPQVNGQGNGIQLQGFNPDYTLILIDGEPIIGRYTGSLELSRITVGNIKQIEIVKGPSSSLYGSDALAGVINIITDRPQAGMNGNFSSRYGTNNTVDLSGDISLTKNKLGVYVFANRYSTDGYDLSPENFGMTVSPFANQTFTTKVTYKLGSKTDLSVAGRHFNENQRFNFEVTSTNEQIKTSGLGEVNDWNINPVLTHRFSDKFKVIGRFYSTYYQTETNLNLDTDGSAYYHDDFKQSFYRPELNAEYFFDDKNIVTMGAGHVGESVQSARYDDIIVRSQWTNYGFTQYEWLPMEKLSIIAGGRFDHNSIYGSQFSPKFSTRFEINKRASLKLSMGRGFKSPDFRQLYNNFTNAAAGGYSVFGTEVFKDRFYDLVAQGQIPNDYSAVIREKLQPERSLAINAGGKVELLPSLNLDLNGFYNSINNLIETQAVALTTSGQSIYTYRNINRAFTTGIESNLSYPFTKYFTGSVGYQLLYAKDKNVAEAVKSGDVYYRDPNTLVTKRLQPGEYYGLYNRSRNTGNIKIFYKHPVTKWEASARVIYRGKYGVGDIRGNIQGEAIPPSDRNSNSILDVHDDFVKAYALVNLSVAKSLNCGLRFQVGVDNLLNYTEPIYIPNLPGRLIYGSVSYNFSKNNVKP